MRAARVNPALASIPLEDRIAVTLFTRRAHAAVNAALAQGTATPGSPEALYARVLASGLNQLPPAGSRLLFRGMSFADADLLRRFLERYAPGASVVEPRFWSVSDSPTVAFRGFGGSVELTFTGGSSARPLGALSPSRTHREGVFLAGTRFDVSTAVTRQTDQGTRHALQLSDAGQE